MRLQQQQRLANREKEHAIQQIQLERDELKQQLHQCQQQLRSLQADRSLLIVSCGSMCTQWNMNPFETRWFVVLAYLYLTI